MLNKYPTLVAEISANHNGSLSNAKKLIKLAKKGGFDYVKLQTYEPKTMTGRILFFEPKLSTVNTAQNSILGKIK